MNILIDIGHPAHVHFFKYAINILKKNNHCVHVATRNLSVAKKLLYSHGIDYEIVSSKRKGCGNRICELMEHNVGIARRLKKWNIDIAASIGGTYMIYATSLSDCKSLVFSDTETARLANRITFPFASRVVTPSIYPDDLGAKHVKYKGFQELAYLHPSYFRPSPRTAHKYGIAKDEPFGLVRFSSWEAAHDVGVQGATTSDKIKMLRILQEQSRVLLIPEGDVAPELEEFAVDIEAEDFHDLLFYASYCVTEGATTATEACILGTPALYINPVKPRNLYEIAKYGLLEMPDPGLPLISILIDFIERHNNSHKSRKMADKIVEDHCDVTAIILEQISSLKM